MDASTARAAQPRASATTAEMDTPAAAPHVTVLAPAAAPRPTPAAAESKTTASPTIRITIGRVDVRAVMAPAAAPRPTPAPPQPLSLDDYAKHREGRRR